MKPGLAALSAAVAATLLAVRPPASAAESWTLPSLDGNLSMADAVALALRQNLALRAARYDRAVAAGLVDEAYGAALPSVALSAGADTKLDGRDDVAYPDGLSAGMSVRQPLWRGGLVSSGIRTARHGLAVADLAILRQEQDTVVETRKAYLDALLEAQLERVHEESLAVAQRLHATTKSRRAAGTVSDYEVLRGEVEVASARADLLNERNARQTAMLTLYRTLAVDQGSAATLTDTLVYEPLPLDDDALVRAALENRPEARIAEARLRIAEEGVRQARAGYHPNVDLFLSASTGRPDGGANDWDDEWRVGVSASYTLFDGFARRGRMRQATAKAEQAAATLRDTEERIRAEVARAVLDVRYAEELYQSQRKNIDLAKEALRMIESGARLGKNTQLEVLDANSAVTEAMGRYYRAVHAHCVAKAALWHATGAPIETPEEQR